jgi:hypothetical protein
MPNDQRTSTHPRLTEEQWLGDWCGFGAEERRIQREAAQNRNGRRDRDKARPTTSVPSISRHKGDSV